MSVIYQPDKTFNVVLYDLPELSKLLSVSERTLRTYIHTGKLKATKIGGKWKVTKENLEAYCRGE